MRSPFIPLVCVTVSACGGTVHNALPASPEAPAASAAPSASIHAANAPVTGPDAGAVTGAPELTSKALA
ncbi:MAG: hypothetical protein ACREJ3_19420, partial [Polyangiaceae bacterium]